MAKKTVSQQLEALEQRQKELAAKKALLRAKEKNEGRKKETRQKIIYGGLVLAHAERDASFAAFLHELAARAVTREADKATIADTQERWREATALKQPKQSAA